MYGKTILLFIILRINISDINNSIFTSILDINNHAITHRNVYTWVKKKTFLSKKRNSWYL